MFSSIFSYIVLHSHTHTRFRNCSMRNTCCSLEMQQCMWFHYMPFPCVPCSSDTVYECPDYHTAGENSCFFNKNDTSIWVNYNITVVATNAHGSSFSDPVDIDVVYIGEGARAACFLSVVRVLWRQNFHLRIKSMFLMLKIQIEKVVCETDDKWVAIMKWRVR